MSSRVQIGELTNEIFDDESADVTKLALADVAAQVLQEHSLAEVVLVAERVVDTGEQEFTVGGWHQSQGGTGGDYGIQCT